MSPGQVEFQKFVDMGCEQLDIEMKDLAANNATLVSQWILWEMAMKEQTFEETSVEFCRMLFKQHMTLSSARAGAAVQAALDEHTIDGSD